MKINKQLILEMAMNKVTYLGSTNPNGKNFSRSIFGIQGDGKDNDSHLRTILYRSSGENSGQPTKHFGTMGITTNSQEKEFQPLFSHGDLNHISKVSAIFEKIGENKVKAILNEYRNTKDKDALEKDHPKIKEARKYMDINQPKFEENIPGHEILNSRIRNYLK
jgi:hypothetical protein